jgi:hypothetical protein
MGNVPNFLTEELLASSDVISGLRKGDNGRDGLNTWGPFTVYRNIPKITQLFRKSPDLFFIFNNHSAFFFDEWGGGDPTYYPLSMTKILNDHAEELGIRWHGGFPLGWDGECADKYLGKERCSECVLSESASNAQSSLTWNRTLFVDESELYKTYDVIMCHFQMGKAVMPELFKQMSNQQKQDLLTANPLYLAYKEGFHK